MLTFEPFTLDVENRQLAVDGHSVTLTSKEFELASYLFRHHDAVLSRRDLLESVWGITAELSTRTVDAHVSRLRNKLNLASTGWEINSIYNHGYCLRHQHQQHCEISSAV